VQLTKIATDVGRHDGPKTEPHSVLMVPGLGNSRPRQWQSFWEILPDFRRIEFDHRGNPRLHEWVPQLDRAIRESPRPLVIAAHCLGCLAAVWWAARHWTEVFREKVCGFLLVAPPDVDDERADPAFRDFCPLPQLRLPVASLLVASRNDPYARFERSAEMARTWGSSLVDAGPAGHINAEARLGEWATGLELVARLTGHNPHRLIAEIGLRLVLA
jgi:predicted alpha/beta hydrolase family esterase